MDHIQSVLGVLFNPKKMFLPKGQAKADHRLHLVIEVCFADLF